MFVIYSQTWESRPPRGKTEESLLYIVKPGNQGHPGERQRTCGHYFEVTLFYQGRVIFDKVVFI